jgi:hypothetical protein
MLPAVVEVQENVTSRIKLGPAQECKLVTVTSFSSISARSTPFTWT